MTTPTAENVVEATRMAKLLNEFEDFINEPTSYEDMKMVRDYRHEIFPRWAKVRKAIEDHDDAAKADTWQPIETAPMDEQEYLVTNGEKTIISKRAKDAGQHLTNKWHYFPRKHQPTHWMPLTPPPEAKAKKLQDAGRDWQEDFSHENGNYFNNCCKCGEQFTGHKRRIICKQCANPTNAVLTGSKS